jgi:hypothetical protein
VDASGTNVRGDNRHVVPDVIHDGNLINIPQWMLFFFEFVHLFQQLKPQAHHLADIMVGLRRYK